MIAAPLAPVIVFVLATIGLDRGYYGRGVRAVLITAATSLLLLAMGFVAARVMRRERAATDDLARALDLSPCMVRSLDGVIEYWPQGCQALYGWTAAEAVGARAQDLLKIQFPEPFEQIRAALLRNGQWTGELLKQTRAGDLRCVAARWVLDDRGPHHPPRIVESATDITALKSTAEALRNTQDRLSLAVATFGLGVIDYDPATKTAVLSREMEIIAGVEAEALDGDARRWQSMFAPGDLDRAMDTVNADMAAKVERREHWARIMRPDGVLRVLRGVRRYLYDVAGDCHRVISLYMDDTEQLRDRAELAARGERLVTLQSELNHASRLSAMGEMAAALAHELNQPLTAVGATVGAIGMLMTEDKPIDGPLRKRILEAATQAEAQTVRAGEIVRRLREFIARGEADSRAENLEALIADAIALAMPNPLASNVELRQDFSPKVREVLADRIQIQQIMINLIRNALEAMRDQTTSRILTISTAAKGAMAEICVSDNGPGVSQEVAARLFSPFVSTKSSGMGVGLSVCLRIVEAHGGKMWVAPSPAGGAAFHFTLPLIRMETRHGR